MKNLVLLVFLLMVGCVDFSGYKSNQPGEEDYDSLQNRFVKEDVSAARYKQWIKGAISIGEPVFTDRCAEYVHDVQNRYWGGDKCLTEEQLRLKWDDVYDLGYANWGHPFENGNCGWQTKEISSIEYLGELNSGSWFEVTISGGCGLNDYSESLVRVIKIITTDSGLRVDNFLSLSDD